MFGKGTDSCDSGLLTQRPGDLHTLTGRYIFFLLVSTAVLFIVLKYPVNKAWCSAGMAGLQILVSLRNVAAVFPHGVLMLADAPRGWACEENIAL